MFLSRLSDSRTGWNMSLIVEMGNLQAVNSSIVPWQCVFIDCSLSQTQQQSRSKDH